MTRDKIAPSQHSICVFCGSSPGNDPKYMALAADMGREIATHKYRLVYGGGGLGLMGAVAKSCFESGGDVLGIIPDFLEEVEGVYKDVPHHTVPDMHTRKRQMYDEANAFITLPGGIGTLEEVVEVISWMRLDLHQKPIIFLDNDDYWQPMLSLLHHTIVKEFSPEWIKTRIFRVTTPQAAIELVRNCLDDPSHRPHLQDIKLDQV